MHPFHSHRATFSQTNDDRVSSSYRAVRLVSKGSQDQNGLLTDRNTTDGLDKLKFPAKMLKRTELLSMKLKNNESVASGSARLQTRTSRRKKLMELLPACDRLLNVSQVEIASVVASVSQGSQFKKSFKVTRGPSLKVNTTRNNRRHLSSH